MKKLFIWLISILAIIGLGIGIYFICNHYISKQPNIEDSGANNSQLQSGEVVIDISDLNIDSPNLSTLKNGVMLFSNNDEGLWYYSLEEDNITRVLAKGKYRNFKEISNGCFIYSQSNENQGLHYFDYETKKLTTIIDKGYNYNNIHVVNDKALISSIVEEVQGFYSFDLVNYNTITLREDDCSWSVIADFDNYSLVTSRATQGLFAYDFKGDNLTLLTEDKKYNGGYKVNDGVLLYNFDSGSLTHFNEQTRVFTTLDIPNGYSTVHKVDDGCFIFASDSGHLGLYFFDYNSCSATCLTSSGWAWNKNQKVKGGYLLSASDYGLLYFDINTKTARTIYPKGYWGEFVKVDDGYLIYEDWAHDKGILYFDENTKTVSKVYDDGYGFSHFDVGDSILFVSYNNVLLYKKSTKQFSQLSERGMSDCKVVEENGMYIFYGNYGGLSIYNSKTQEFKIISEFGRYSVEKSDNGLTIRGDREVYTVDEQGELKAIAIIYQIPQAA